MTTYYTQLNKTLTPLALPVEIDGSWKLHPTAEQAARFYAYPRNDAYTPGTPPEDKQWQLAPGYTLHDGKWCQNFEAVDIPPAPPRRWSRLSIKTALAQAEMLAAARAYLSAVEIATRYTAWEALTDCDYIEEGYPTAERWSAILDGAAAALGKTRAEIDAFLDMIPTEA